MTYDPNKASQVVLVDPATGNTIAAGAATLGAQGNIWNAASVGAGATSTPLALTGQTKLAVLGHASAATTIRLLLSLDGTHFYEIDNIPLTAAGDFAFTGSQYEVPAVTLRVALKSDQAATITATLMGSA